MTLTVEADPHSGCKEGVEAKEAANECFRSGKYERACFTYHRADLSFSTSANAPDQAYKAIFDFMTMKASDGLTKVPVREFYSGRFCPCGLQKILLLTSPNWQHPLCAMDRHRLRCFRLQIFMRTGASFRMHPRARPEMRRGRWARHSCPGGHISRPFEKTRSQRFPIVNCDAYRTGVRSSSSGACSYVGYTAGWCPAFRAHVM